MIWRRAANSVAASAALINGVIPSSAHTTIPSLVRVSTFGFSTVPISNFESALRHLSSSKNKDKQFMADILRNTSFSDFNPTQLTELIKLVQVHSLNLLSLASLITASKVPYDDLNTDQITLIIESFSNAPCPQKANDFAPIISFLTQCDERLINQLDLAAFLKGFNQALQADRGEIEVTTITGWIGDLQKLNPRIEFNGVLTEKLYDELYDKSETEWLEVIRVYSPYGNLDIELLQEFDKQTEFNSIIADYEFLVHYLNLCAAKDFKPKNTKEILNTLKERILKQGNIIASPYLESLEYSQTEFLQSVFDDLLKNGVDPRVIEESSNCSRDFLRAFGVIPKQNIDLIELIRKRDAAGILRFVSLRKHEKNEKEYILNIHEMFLITQYIKETDMTGRKRAAKDLNLPHLIAEIEISLLTEMNALVNRFMKEKAWKKASSLRQFLEVNCISHCLGFDKQAVECFEGSFSSFKSQFSHVFSLPLLSEFGVINSELFVSIIPEYSKYIVSKYIQRNQLDFNEALIILRCIYSMKDLYMDMNAKYVNKEFVYGVKGIVRLAILTFQKRIYSNFNDVKAKKPSVENPFLESEPLTRTGRSKFQEEDDLKIQFAQDLDPIEIDQFLELFQFANTMNVGSKEFYDSLPLFVLAYYDSLSLEQKSIAAYLVSTIDSSDEKIEKLIESSIQSNTSFTLLQATRFLSFLTTRYCLNEDLWKKLITVIKQYEGEIEKTLSKEMKLSLALSRECLRLEQPHIKFEMTPDVVEHLLALFVKDQVEQAKRSTKFSEAISYFLTRLGYYHEKEQKQSIFSFMFSQAQSQSYVIVLDKHSFIGDTKAQRASVSVMIRMLTKLNLKLKIFNVYDWATKQKRHEKVAYLKSKVKGMAFDPEKQKKKTHFNF